MPVADCGVTAAEVDDFDRSKQFAPYQGPTPPVGAVFMWVVKVLKFQPRTKDKNASLVVGLELEPRNKDEEKYAGYFVMSYRTVADNTQGFYVPFLDAIGVTATDFTKRTVVDDEGNVKRIGRNYQHTGDVLVLGQLKQNEYQGKTRMDIGWFGEVTDDPEIDVDDEEGDDDEFESF